MADGFILVDDDNFILVDDDDFILVESGIVFVLAPVAQRITLPADNDTLKA